MLDTFHVAQLNMKLPKIVTLNTCGVASMIQVLKYFNKLENKAPEEIFFDFVKFGRYTSPFISLFFPSIPKLGIPYTPLISPTEEKDLLIEINNWEIKNRASGNISEPLKICKQLPNGKKYLPTFSLKYGSDSRGIQAFIQSKGLKVSLYEYVKDGAKKENLLHKTTPEKKGFGEFIKQELFQGNVVIASVKKVEIPYLNRLATSLYGPDSPELIGTHLITLKRINNRIYILDPLITKAKEAVKYISFDRLFKALTRDRSRGSFLSISS